MSHFASPQRSSGSRNRYAETRTDDSDRVDLGGLFRKIWLRKRLIILCVLGGAVLAGLAVSQVTPQYTSGAKVMLDARKVRILADNAIVGDLNVTEQVVNSEVAVVRSNVLIEAVVKKVGFERLNSLDPRSSSPSLGERVKQLLHLAPANRDAPTEEQRNAQKLERLVFAIRNSMTVRREGKSLVIGIAVQTADPQLSMILARAISEEYIATQLTARQRAAQSATASIEARVASLKSEVEAAEEAVQDYITASLSKDGASVDTASGQVIDLNKRIAQARADHAAARARYRQLSIVIQNQGLNSAESLVSTPRIDDLKTQRADLQHRDDLLADRYDSSNRLRARLATQIQQLTDDIGKEILRQLEVYRGEEQTTATVVDSLTESLTDQEQRVSEISTNSIGLKELESKAAALRATYEALLARMTDSRAQEDLQKADARLVERATIPGAPSYPRPKLIIFLGAMAGLVAGFALVFSFEMAATSYRSEQDVEADTGLPVLASLPVGQFKTPLQCYDSIDLMPNGVFAERLRHLRTAAQSIVRPSEGGASYLVSSSLPDEGKTTTTLALARMFAMAGKSVVIVDCDLRRSSFRQMLNVRFSYDLADFIDKQCTLGQAVYRDERLDFDLLAVDEPMPSGGDRISRDWLVPMLRTLKKHYDVVLVDAPPVLSVSDPLVLSQVVDTSLFLVRWGQTPRAAVRKAVRALDELGAAPSGVVMTMVDPARAPEQYAGEYAYVS